MLIGFVLILISASAEPMPVSERIYPDKASCEQIKTRLIERRPSTQLDCSPVYNKKMIDINNLNDLEIDISQN